MRTKYYEISFRFGNLEVLPVPLHVPEDEQEGVDVLSEQRISPSKSQSAWSPPVEGGGDLSGLIIKKIFFVIKLQSDILYFFNNIPKIIYKN